MILRLLWLQAKREPLLTTIAMILHVVLAVLWVAEPLYSSFAIDRLLQIKEGVAVDVPLILGGWALLFVIISVADGFEKYVSWQVDNLLYIHRREEVYAHALNLDVAFHTSQKSGETIKVLDDGADNLLDLQRALFVDIGPSLLSASAFLAISFFIQPLLAAVLVLSLVAYTGIVVFGVKRTAKLQQEVNKIWVEAIGRAYDAATNILPVKSNVQERYELGRMEASGRIAHRKQQSVNKRWALIESMNFFMLTRLLITALGILLYIWNRLTLGQLYFFQASFFRVLTPFEILANLLPSWNKKLGKIRLAQDILETPVAIKSPASPVIPKTFSGAIVFEDVCFSYMPQTAPVPETGHEPQEIDASIDPTPHGSNPEEERAAVTVLPPASEEPSASAAEEPSTREELVEEAEREGHDGEVLHNISLDVRPGEHIAFVGHSGAGKTTLAMLLNRFYDVTRGKISVDGTDLRDLDVDEWRGCIGLVLQENIMFNDSIKENIRYSRPDASMEDVRDAARRAAADEFVESLPEQYETVIGDRGIRLSGGQRQRIAIARAILKNPKIVILDEATSALDSVTERKVQDGIKELVTGRTSFIIAHRLSTVRSVDRIAVFDSGCLIAVAPHAELVKTCPIYREMVELQSEGMLSE